MTEDQLRLEAIQLINILVIFSDEEKDVRIAQAKTMSLDVLQELFAKLSRAKRTQDEIIARLPPEKSRALSQQLDTVLRQIRERHEATATQEEEHLLKDIAAQIASL